MTQFLILKAGIPGINQKSFKLSRSGPKNLFELKTNWIIDSRTDGPGLSWKPRTERVGPEIYFTFIKDQILTYYGISLSRNPTKNGVTGILDDPNKAQIRLNAE